MNDKENIILFVDDDENILRSWRRVFQNENMQMKFARNVQEALPLIAKNDVSVIISDYSMPDGDGISLLAKVKDISPSTIRIMVSGKANIKVATEALNRCGIAKLFQKPCDISELVIAVRESLGLAKKALPEELVVLEEDYPGISNVQRDQSGAIIIEDA